MKILPTKIRKNRFGYTLVCRGERSCVYEQKLRQITVGYEVFRIKVNPASIVFGNKVEEREIFPSNEAFGDWAWSTYTMKKAMKKFQELESENIADPVHII